MTTHTTLSEAEAQRLLAHADAAELTCAFHTNAEVAQLRMEAAEALGLWVAIARTKQRDTVTSAVGDSERDAWHALRAKFRGRPDLMGMHAATLYFGPGGEEVQS